jgi:hypothetical protein
MGQFPMRWPKGSYWGLDEMGCDGMAQPKNHGVTEFSIQLALHFAAPLLLELTWG